MISRFLLAGAILGLLALPSRAADPFYLERLEQGKAAAARGDLAEAQVDLEIACFGFLDEPVLLIEGLVHRALVADGLGQAALLGDLLGRILLVEDRFAPYAAADLDDVRPQFEDLVYRRSELVRAIEVEAFAHLGERRFAERFAAAGPGERRTLLLERLAVSPGNALLIRQLADLETSAGQHGAALPYLDQLLEQQPGDAELRCRRFAAATHAGLCEQALVDAGACPETAADPTIAVEMLDCLSDLALWDEASAYVESLPVTTRSISRVRKLERRTGKGLKAQQRLVAARPPEIPEEESPSFAETETSTEPVHPEPAETPDTDPAASPTTSVEHEPSTSTPPVSEPPPDPCQAFRQAARKNNCPGILADLATCQAEAQDIRVARPALRCLAAEQEWQQATDLLNVLPPHVRSSGKIRKLERRVSKGLADATDTAPTDIAPTDTAPVDTPANDTTAEVLSPTSAPSAAELDEPQSRADAETLESRIDGLRQRLQGARTTTQLTGVLADTTRLAREHSDLPAAQFLAAETAYRSGQWRAAVLFFERGGDLGNDQPLLLFYRAIALFETGDFTAAAESLERALPRLQHTSFVDTYTSRIRSAAAN